MTLNDLVAPSLMAIHHRLDRYKLILLHPMSRWRSLLVAALIESPPCALYYYSVGVTDVSLESFLDGLTAVLTKQNVLFGQHLAANHREAPADIAALALATAQDLAELAAEDVLLILDELDRVDHVPAIITFLETLLDYLPAHCHLMVSSRTMPRLPWMSLIARGQVGVLREGAWVATDYYGEDPTVNPTLEVFALGPGCVFLNGELVETWNGQLPQLMLFFAVDHPAITRADICQAFWPEVASDDAVNVFHVTKRRLHTSLDVEALSFENKHYRLNPTIHLQYDVKTFISHLVQARDSDGDQALSHWQQAVEVYRGSYLQGWESNWIEKKRAAYQAGYAEALRELGGLYWRRRETDQALGAYLRAATEDPHDEVPHLAIMELYHSMDRKEDVRQYYEHLTQVRGFWPSPEMQAIYTALPDPT